MSKKVISIVAAMLFLLLGISLGFILASSFGVCNFTNISVYHWATLFTLILVLFSGIYMYKIKKEDKDLSENAKRSELESSGLHTEIDQLRTDFERFKREVRHFCSAELHMLFSLSEIWDKREAESFTEWKKKSLKELRNSLTEIQWCQEIIEECKPSNGKNSNQKPK